MQFLETDRYGFRLDGLSAAEASSRAACVAREAKMAERKWAKESVLQSLSLDTTAPRATKQLVRDCGIPEKLRPAVWLKLSGGLAKSQQYPPGIYSELEDGAKFTWATSACDILRALGARHPVLATAEATAALHRITGGVYYLSQGGVGVQLNPDLLRLGAFLLAVLGLKNEETAFWILFALAEEHLMDVMEDPYGRSLEQLVLEALVAKRCPRLVDTLKYKETSFCDLTGSWFPTLFTTVLPAETAVRVWDCLFVEGPKILHRVALALLKMHESHIIATPYGLQTGHTLKWRCARLYNVEVLFKVAFSGIGTLSAASITRERKVFEEQICEALASQRRRLESVLTAPLEASWPTSFPALQGISPPATPEGLSGGETASEISSCDTDLF